MLSSQLAGQNQETMDLNVGPALNGDMVATAVGEFSLKFESWDPLVCNQSFLDSSELTDLRTEEKPASQVLGRPKHGLKDGIPTVGFLWRWDLVLIPVLWWDLDCIRLNIY